MKKLTEATSPEEKIKVLFFSILNREPTKEELKMCMAELSQAATKSIVIIKKFLNIYPKRKRKP